MKKLVLCAVLGLATVSTCLLSSRAAKADVVINGDYVNSTQAINNSWAADHPDAYAQGYRQGEQSDREGKPYQPRTAGGEFARGFEDGYFNRPYTGQKVVTLTPPVIYNYPPVVYNYPNPAINFDFGFGGWHHKW
ncbi:MAG: hypothetical protein JO235_02255 [Chroococcidiopsidaceae cyanobacterium CP_BM_RX_35]|nr:hypothetical protein [Chroococcidiopsidaceae cyanobacterium CP_BM_RX_35]